ncbi:MAG: 50S ribosomal protein L6 [archaeon]
MAQEQPEREKIKREIEFSGQAGVSVSFSGKTLVVRGPKGEVRRNFSNPFVAISVEGGKVLLESGPKKKPKAVIESSVAHINNMLVGATKGFRYRLEIVQSHFPSKVTSSGGVVKIENFTGEKCPRLVKIEKGVRIKVEGKDVFLSGPDLEAVAKSAQKLEDGTKIRKKDRRTFQDGIYIMERKLADEGAA